MRQPDTTDNKRNTGLWLGILAALGAAAETGEEAVTTIAPTTEADAVHRTTTLRSPKSTS
jgi:hypothetical protein